MYTQDFFFFQTPAIYAGGQEVYSNSIYEQSLLPYSTSGSVLTFQMTQQYYAGAQTQVKAPAVGSVSGYTTASQAINLASSGSTAANTTNMSIGPLGLSAPAYTSGVESGAYRIVTPTFNPTVDIINVGSAILNTQTNLMVLSNFIVAQPNQNVDCQPILEFYVQTGSYQAGTVIDFTSSSVGAAGCDTTPGYTVFNVTYNIDGTWSVVAS